MRIHSTDRVTKSLFFLVASFVITFVIATVYPYHAKADTLPVIHKSGELTSNETWTNGNVYVIDGALFIPDGVSLTINAGAIVKLNNTNTYYGIIVDKGGTLNAAGTTASPVIFTSLQDDSAGGDSNADGSTVGSAGDYSVGLNITRGAVSLSHTTVRYAQRGIMATCGSGAGNISINDSLIESQVDFSGCAAGVVSMQRNNFAVPSGSRAINTSGSAIDGIILAGNDKNTFTGVGSSKVIYLNQATVPSGRTWNITGEGGAMVVIGQYLYIEGDVNIAAGTTIKLTNAYTFYGISVADGGKLNATGTFLNPITLTSLQDDSIGGDNGNDGSTTGSNTDNQVIFTLNSGSDTELKHIIAKNSSTAVSATCGNSGSVLIEDSTIEANTSVSNCSAASLHLIRNSFDAVGNTNALTIANSDVSGVVFSGANKNNFGGTGQHRVAALNSVTVPDEVTATLSSNGGATIKIGHYLNVEGTLNVDPGTILKVENSSLYYGISLSSNGGTVNANGTSASPVIVTSLNDDSFGGDSNGDGSATSPSRGDYGSAVMVNDSAAKFNTSYTKILYASTAVEVFDGDALLQNTDISHIGTGLSVGQSNSDKGDVIYRGSITDASVKAVKACNWNRECKVDATFTDWGGVVGPYLTSGLTVCGSVIALPWVHGGVTYDGQSLFVPNCDGSPTPAMALDTSVSNFQSRMNTKQIDCSNGFQSACDAMETAMTCLTGAVNVASSTSPIPLPEISSQGDVESFGDTVKGVAADAVRDEAVQSVLPSSPRLGGLATSLIGTFTALASAYNSCAP